MIAHARYYRRTCTLQPTPAPFQHFLVYSAQGSYDPLEGPFPEGCSPEDPLITSGFCTDTEERFFHKKIMGFSEEESNDEERKAKGFFLQRFGLDAETLLEQGRATFTRIRFDPRQDFRAFVFSGECVSSEGYKWRNGGFLLSIIDPEGVELGGEFDGQKAPEGSGVLFGMYNILITGPYAREEIIRYRSLMPTATSRGITTVNCELHHPAWGEGLLQGLISSRMQGDGKLQAATRSVLTFPPFGNP